MFMSFTRLIYWSGLLGGWSAFIAWLFCEVIFGRWANEGLLGLVLAILMSTLVATAIGAGLSQAAGLVNFQWPQQAVRLAFGLVGGFIGGLLGSVFGNVVYALLGGIPIIGIVGRIFGWTVMGGAIGVVEGVYDRSLKKIRNGLIGGLIGGFIGGLLFNPVSFIIGSPVSSRAIAFVLLGLFVGFLVGLVQVVLREAWVTVESGFRPGRQLILGQHVTTMGTSEKAGLIFIAYGAQGVEPVHLRIVRGADGSFVLHDNNSRTGTLLNGARLATAAVLRDGDLVQFGVNVIRFNERYRRADVMPQRASEKSAAPPVALPRPHVMVEQPIVATLAAEQPIVATLLPPVPAQVAVVKTVSVPVASAPAAPAPARPVKPAAPMPALATAGVKPLAPAQAAAASPTPQRVPTSPQPGASPATPTPPAAKRCPLCGSQALASTAGTVRCKDCWAVIS
jgi:hypothetical protein